MKLFRLQFRLWVLLALVLLVALPLKWLRHRLNLARNQEEAVRVLSDAGTIVSYDFEEATGDGDASVPKRSPQWLQRVLGTDFFADVVSVDLSGWNVWNDAYKSLDDYHFNDKNARLLEDLPNLRYLNASNSHLTDEGMASLGGLRKLEQLLLSSPYVTDKGLEYLKDLGGVKLIVLHCPKVTEAGVRRLADALPRAHVEHYGFLVTLDESEGGGFM